MEVKKILIFQNFAVNNYEGKKECWGWVSSVGLSVSKLALWKFLFTNLKDFVWCVLECLCFTGRYLPWYKATKFYVLLLKEMGYFLGLRNEEYVKNGFLIFFYCLFIYSYVCKLLGEFSPCSLPTSVPPCF
jgi:hypothetical protein